MIQLRFTHTVTLTPLLALSLAGGCSSNRSRGRTVDSGTAADSGAGTIDTGTTGGQAECISLSCADGVCGDPAP